MSYLTREHATCAAEDRHVATQRHPRSECPTVTVNEPHTPDSVVVLSSGKVLEHGLYPNPDHHRGQPAGHPGVAIVAGRRHRAVTAPDGKVWVRVDGAYGPTGDWFHARSATFTPDPVCPECGRADTTTHDLGPEFLVCAGCCEIRYADAARELADRVTA